jgi:hypothetical protein
MCSTKKTNQEFATGRFLPRAFMKYGWDLYAPGDRTRKTIPTYHRFVPATTNSRSDGVRDALEKSDGVRVALKQ